MTFGQEMRWRMNASHALKLGITQKWLTRRSRVRGPLSCADCESRQRSAFSDQLLVHSVQRSAFSDQHLAATRDTTSHEEFSLRVVSRLSWLPSSFKVRRSLSLFFNHESFDSNESSCSSCIRFIRIIRGLFHGHRLSTLVPGPATYFKLNSYFVLHTNEQSPLHLKPAANS